jgi:hypothetical protein
MEQGFEQGYRMHRVLSNRNRLDVDRLDDADRERYYSTERLIEFAAPASGEYLSATPSASRVENCAHTDFRDGLREYLDRGLDRGGHVPHHLETAFDWQVDR